MFPFSYAHAGHGIKCHKRDRREIYSWKFGADDIFVLAVAFKFKELTSPIVFITYFISRELSVDGVPSPIAVE